MEEWVEQWVEEWVEELRLRIIHVLLSSFLMEDLWKAEKVPVTSVK